MPNKLAENHDKYLNNFLATNTSKVINQSRVLIGLHKSGYIFPFNIYLKVIFYIYIGKLKFIWRNIIYGIYYARKDHNY